MKTTSTSILKTYKVCWFIYICIDMFENLKKIFCEYWKLRLFKLQCIGSKVKKIGELRYVFSTKRSYLDYMTKKAYLISRWCEWLYVILTIILMLGVWPCPLGIWLPSDRWRNAGKKSSSCPQGVAEPPRAVLLGLEPNFYYFDFLNPLMKLLRLMANKFWARSRSRLDSKNPKPGDGKKKSAPEHFLPHLQYPKNQSVLASRRAVRTVSSRLWFDIFLLLQESNREGLIGTTKLGTTKKGTGV